MSRSRKQLEQDLRTVTQEERVSSTFNDTSLGVHVSLLILQLEQGAAVAEETSEIMVLFITNQIQTWALGLSSHCQYNHVE